MQVGKEVQEVLWHPRGLAASGPDADSRPRGTRGASPESRAERALPRSPGPRRLQQRLHAARHRDVPRVPGQHRPVDLRRAVVEEPGRDERRRPSRRGQVEVRLRGGSEEGGRHRDHGPRHLRLYRGPHRPFLGARISTSRVLATRSPQRPSSRAPGSRSSSPLRPGTRARRCASSSRLIARRERGWRWRRRAAGVPGL